MQTKPINTTRDVLSRQRHNRLSSSSEEADEMLQASNNDWQMRCTKRKKKTHSLQPINSKSQTETYNRYDVQQQTQLSQENKLNRRKNHKPLPIFIHSH
jgi:predicted transcriptional regulator